MPFCPPADAPRRAVVDLGSNSVRLVVFEGSGRNPVAIFNEKATPRLGRGLQQTGRLNAEGVEQVLPVLSRFDAVARAMGAEPFEVLATAAVRDAANGPAFVAALQARMPGVPIRILSGDEEAALSAEGVLCGIPGADGILADIGGGSLELVRLSGGGIGPGCSLPLGVIRLSDRAEGSLERAKAVAQAELDAVPWLLEGAGRDLYLVGGAWRALARIHMARVAYPLNIVHHYTVERAEALEFAALIAGTPRKALERMPGVPRKRVEDMPVAAVVLRRLLRAIQPRRVVLSANGIREGWFMRRVPEATRAEDPLLAAGSDLAARFGRDPAMPAALVPWTASLFAHETAAQARLREAACLVSDTGSHDHPDYRAEQACLRVLRQPGVGLDHPERAFLSLVVALRYEAEPDAAFLGTARRLLDPAGARRAEVLGRALRLAYTLCAGTPDLLSGTSLRVDGGRLVLRVAEGHGASAGEGVARRLGRLADALGVQAATERG